MNPFNPDTYCGLYCGACSIAMFGQTGRADGLAACLGSVPSADLVCGGCKSDVVYAGCSMCSLRRCARDKGIAHCIDCGDYPCRTYRAWQSSAKFLPHAREAVPNLKSIQRDGAVHWLDTQKKRWSCSECSTPFSWYASECSQCGRSLSGHAHSLSGWRKFLCRIVLPMVYRKAKAKRSADSPLQSR